MEALVRTLPCPPPDDFRDLLMFCSGIAGALNEIDFTGRTLSSGFDPDFLLPRSLPIAHDGAGNYWAVDLRPGATGWGPIYFCCHDAPVLLVQAAGIQEFVVELIKMYTPPHKSLIHDVNDDNVFDVWRKNPGVISLAEAQASDDPEIRSFAASLAPGSGIIDLRGAPVGMGFSWGRYGAHTEVTRFGALPIFAYRRPEKRSLLAKLFGR